MAPPADANPSDDPAAPADAGAYRVLARKYRPASFAALIGQEAMVRTLTNAFATGRIAHAFVLTGVRGVGKTTTARIIARALNCVGADGSGGPTIQPCGRCANCVQILDERHLDVIEMDAASRTGVDDMRELIDGVRYGPVQARYKVYIIDEVHMLSKAAFNALLKTLEEPPPHVKFVFATTEIGKVPVTVLSRCQRFDLRRVEGEVLARHLDEVARQEGRTLDPAASALLARAADGSVRDGLSLLDRALAHVDGTVGEAGVRELLGLADRTQVFDLFEALLRGRTADALERIATLYRDGAEPANVAEELLDLTHWLTRLKAVPALAEDRLVPEAERARGRVLAAKLSVPTLARAWQMLLKGYAEIQAAPRPLAALEMLAVRLAHAAELPTPGEIVAGTVPMPPGGGGIVPARGAPAGGVTAVARAVEPGPVPVADDPRTDPRSFAAVVELFAARREALLASQLRSAVHLVRFEPGRIEWRPTDQAPRDLSSRVMDLLQRWTGRRWVIALAQQEPGEPTLAEQDAAADAARTTAAATHPLVRALLDAFPGASIETVQGEFSGADESGPPAVRPEPLADTGEPEESE